MNRCTLQWGYYFAFAAAIGCSSSGGAAPAEPTVPEAVPTTPAAVPDVITTAAASFSAAQAASGRTVFDGVCSSCHSTGDFRGNSFIYSWRQRNAWQLYRQVVETMPEDAPGSLPDDEYVDVVAFILELNGHDAGDGELAATEAALSQIPVDPSGTELEGPKLPSRPDA